jgi:hypothetical protein
MAYEAVTEPGETVLANIQLRLSKKAQPFFFAVSDRAIYIPRVRLIAKTDPYYFQRVPFDHIQHITIRRLPPYALWLLAGLMIPIGLLTTYLMMEPVMRHEPGVHQISGWPIAVFVCGFLVPVAARGRFGLDISFRDGEYRWKPPLVIDSKSEQKIADSLQSIFAPCEKSGTRVLDERKN